MGRKLNYYSGLICVFLCLYWSSSSQVNLSLRIKEYKSSFCIKFVNHLSVLAYLSLRIKDYKSSFCIKFVNHLSVLANLSLRITVIIIFHI